MGRMVQMGQVVRMDRTGRAHPLYSLKEIVIYSEKNRIFFFMFQTQFVSRCQFNFISTKNIHKRLKCATLLLQMKANVKFYKGHILQN